MKTKSLKFILASIMMSLSLIVFADDNIDIIVTNDGESLKVYNLDYSPVDYCYYTIVPNSDDLKRIKKSDVLIIKLADGTKLDPNTLEITNSTIESTKSIVVNPAAHEPVTVTAIENNFLDVVTQKAKKGKPEVIDKYILIKESNGQILNLRLVSEVDKELSVARLRDGSMYETAEIIIPEYVILNGENYSITQIDPAAFDCKGKENISDIIFPQTLVEIGQKACYMLPKLKRIILPESLKKIGEAAFYGCASRPSKLHKYQVLFQELYIPKNVESIGEKAFLMVGNNISPNWYFQGNLKCIPDFITENNCHPFGIDEEAVEVYLNRNK